MKLVNSSNLKSRLGSAQEWGPLPSRPEGPLALKPSVPTLSASSRWRLPTYYLAPLLFQLLVTFSSVFREKVKNRRAGISRTLWVACKGDDEVEDWGQGTLLIHGSPCEAVLHHCSPVHCQLMITILAGDLRPAGWSRAP